MGTDEALGTVHQIIMNQRTGELQALVIVTDNAQQLELPATHVLRATESAVYLDVAAEDLRRHPELATPYNPDRYVPVRAHPLLSPTEASRGVSAHERPLVTNVERDAIDVVAPAAPKTTPLSSPPAPMSDTSDTSGGPFPPSSLTPTAPLIERPTEEHSVANKADTTQTDEASAPNADNEVDTTPTAPDGAADVGVDNATALANDDVAEGAMPGAEEAVDDDDDTTPAMAVPIVNPDDSSTDEPVADTNPSALIADDDAVPGPESATAVSAGLSDIEAAIPIWEEEEGTFMEGSTPQSNPVNPGVMSNTIHYDEDTISEALDQSQQAYTRSTPPDATQRAWAPQGLASSPAANSNANRFAWLPAVALGAVFVGVATWSTVRTIRRGRRKAAQAALNARISAESLRASVRDSVRGAGKSAVDLAQTMRASAQEIAANPRDTANDAFSNLSEFPVRYRWFRRGMRVGAQAERLRRR
jgi:hypothetical protein